MQKYLALSFEQILDQLRKKKFEPVYFLHGEEDYFIDTISNYFEKEVLPEVEQAFNQTIFYGKDTDHLAVLDAARRYPMMSPYQVVIIKEAQDMRSLDKLQTYIEKPAATTLLVICHKHKKYNLNSAFGKAVKAGAVVFESKSLYDNQIPEWIRNYLKEKQLQITPDAANLLAEYLGTELGKVANELDKLALNMAPGAVITPTQVEENIGISKDYNVFELQKALSQRDVLKANRIVNYFADNPRKNPIQVVISSLYGYFSKIYMLQFVKDKSESEILEALQLRSAFFLKEYRAALRFYPVQKLEDVISHLKTFDLKSKGVDYDATGKPEGELLRELVWKILH